MEVSAKSIQRDPGVSCATRLELPLEYDPPPSRLLLHRTGKRLPPRCKSRRGELFALLVAEKALQQYRGTSFREAAHQRVQENVVVVCRTTISLNLADWEQTISFHTRGGAEL